jgi:hypothetical protein
VGFDLSAVASAKEDSLGVVVESSLNLGLNIENIETKLV